MANMNHSSTNRSKHRHQNHHATTINGNWPEHHDFIVTTRKGIALRKTTSQIPLRRLHNVQCTALSKDEDSSSILIAHNGRILVHDAKSGKSTTYRLKGNDVEVKCLVAMPRSQNFLFWTKRSNVIREISCATKSLTAFSCVHSCEPTCLAISQNGRYLVSCSRRPATVYLQDMERPKSQIPVRLRATRSHVVVTVFHPERPAVFLLAHNDGSVAIHDARRVLRLRDTGIKTDGLIRYVSALHHHGIVSAAFLPGYKMRVITLGSHGKCRITEFEDTITMIVTWDVGLQCTTLAIFSPSPTPSSTTQAMDSSDETVRVNVKTSVALIPQSNTLIAIGCSNGASKVYNSIGLLQSELLSGTSSVVGLHWIERKIVDSVNFQSSTMKIVDIDWPPALSPPSSQESSKSLSLRKENHRLAQEIAKIKLPNGVKPIRDHPFEQLSPVTSPTPKYTATKVTKRNSPPRTPRRSPPRTSSPPKTRTSQSNLLATLKRRRQATIANVTTPPRKNLHDEPPGSSPREAQYIPGVQMSTAAKALASSPQQSSRARHVGQRGPTPFEAHLLGGALLAAEQSLNMRHGQPALDSAEETAKSGLVEYPRPNKFEVHLMNGTLLAAERAKVQKDSQRSLARSALATASPSPPRQQALPVDVPGTKLGSLRAEYSSKDNELVKTSLKTKDAQSSHTIQNQVSHHHQSSDHHHAWPPPLSPMPGQYPSSSSASSEQGDSTYEEAQEYGSHHIREPWRYQDQPPSGEHESIENACDCGCADVVRGEMALVRSEIVSLRKTVWVLAAGLGFDGGGLDSRSIRSRGEYLWSRAE